MQKKCCDAKCYGVQGERKCLPCLRPECASKSGLYDDIREDELCQICYTGCLRDEACTMLSCGHVFHTNCIIMLLNAGWPTTRMTFGFMSCPLCKQEIKVNGISTPVAKVLGPLLSLKRQVEREGLVQAEKQGILSDERLTTPGDAYYGKVQEFVNHRCSFYQCFECKKPYFGGLIDCE